MMKIKNKFKIIFIASLILLLTLLGINCIIFSYKGPEEYRAIDKQLRHLELGQFHYDSIKENSNYIRFDFSLIENDFNKYSKNEAMNDIYKIREKIADYLKNNQLNDNFITIVFNTFPGDNISVFNYNFLENSNSIFPSTLNYFRYLDVDYLSSIERLKEAHIINGWVSKIDNLSIFEDFKNLERLEIYSQKLTHEEQIYLLKVLPNCIIIWNGETISD